MEIDQRLAPAGLQYLDADSIDYHIMPGKIGH
jgi:hypothetical protein